MFAVSVSIACAAVFDYTSKISIVTSAVIISFLCCVDGTQMSLESAAAVHQASQQRSGGAVTNTPET